MVSLELTTAVGTASSNDPGCFPLLLPSRGYMPLCCFTYVQYFPFGWYTQRHLELDIDKWGQSFTMEFTLRRLGFFSFNLLSASNK